MFSTEDTIVAIATPPGRGGIGVIRISGLHAHTIARQLVAHGEPFAPRHATLTLIRLSADNDVDPEPARAVDQAVVTFFPRPSSYTGEDVVELSAHGSPVVLRTIVACAIRAGARPAEPGEFTLRAFLNGRIDLPQAEAVADLIEAVTPLQARVAFDQLQGTLTRAIGEIDAELFDLVAGLEASVDFPDEGYHFVEPGALASALAGLGERLDGMLQRGRRGRMIRDGHVVAIVGAPNVGKSSIFNALLGADRAIVTPVPGTTRDLVTETVDLNGLRVTLVDTAGIRQTNDAIESEGIERSLGAASIASVVVEVLDGTAAESALGFCPQRADIKRVEVLNKCDLAGFRPKPDTISVSAVTGAGLAALRQQVAAALEADDSVDCPEITNVRHLALLERARKAVQAAQEAVGDGAGMLSEEFVLADLQDARAALEEISGRRSSEELLAHIFGRFCIGK